MIGVYVLIPNQAAVVFIIAPGVTDATSLYCGFNAYVFFSFGKKKHLKPFNKTDRIKTTDRISNMSINNAALNGWRYQ